MTRTATATAAAHSDLPGYRADRAEWPVHTERAEGAYFLLCTCSCGAPYLRAMGVRGRPREHCSDTCKDLRPMLNRLATMVDEVAARAGEHGGDRLLLQLRAELMGLTQASEFQSALGRRSQQLRRARLAAAAK